ETTAAASSELVQEVLQATHGQERAAEKRAVDKEVYRAALATNREVRIDSRELSIAGKQVRLTNAQSEAMTLLEPNRQLIAGVTAALKNKDQRVTLISAPPG